MKKLFFAVSLMALLFPLTAIAQSKFDGTWKIEKRQPSKKPYILMLQNGTYQCKTCIPPVEIPADGQDHKVSANPYADTQNAKVVNDRTIERTSKKNGKTVLTQTYTVSPDGKTLTVDINDATATNADPVIAKAIFIRLTAGPAGSHAISGSWQLVKDTQSENGNTFTLKVEGDSVTMTTPTGQSYTAKLGGPDAPYKGDPGTTSVSLKRIGFDTIEETDKRDGKAIFVSRMTVGADGKTMAIVNTGVESGRIFRDTAVKQ